MNKKTLITLTALTLTAGATMVANEPEAGFEESTTADDQADTRLNPELGAPTPVTVETPSHYRFLNLDANRIIMNGASWQSLADDLRAARQSGQVVNIVHIGDSHTQADGNTGQVRSHLQSTFGNAGRGLMSPLRIAGTNQPLDYTITTVAPVTTGTLMRNGSGLPMGFTGVAVKPGVALATFTVSVPKSPFNSIDIFASKPVTVTAVTTDGTRGVDWDTRATDYGASVTLGAEYTKVAVTVRTDGATVYGFSATNSGRGGVRYHSIGNNGATYGSYSAIADEGRSLASLHPDLVIVSLGANEAYGKVSDAAFRNQIDGLVREIRSHNPNARILLTTPAESQRRVTTRRRRKGRRRRYTTTTTYQVNQNVKRLRNVILEYGRDNGIPVYDFYAVAGGDGSSKHWIQNGLMSRDRIHRTWKGYYLEGDLLYQALIQQLGMPPIETGTIESTPVESQHAQPMVQPKAPATDAGTVSKKRNNSRVSATTKKKKRKVTKRSGRKNKKKTARRRR